MATYIPHVHVDTCTYMYMYFNPGTSPHVSDVFRLYCGLEAGLTVKDMCMVQDLRTMNVDERYSNMCFLCFSTIRPMHAEDLTSVRSEVGGFSISMALTLIKSIDQRYSTDGTDGMQ